MAISATTSVLTGEDWKLAKDIHPGDWVFNRLGKPVKVKTAQMYRSEDCYRVTFDDYLSVEGDKHLSYPIEDREYRNRTHKYKGRFKRTTKPKVKTVTELLEAGLFFREGRKQFSSPTTEPIELPTQPLGIPPFIYGFWFFARYRRRILRVPIEFTDNVVQKFKDSGYQVTMLPRIDEHLDRFRTVPSIWDQLRGEQTHKLPLSYLNGSSEQRLELIQGILSAYPLKKASKIGLFEYHHTKKHIITAIQFLAESLGAKTKIAHYKKLNIYRLRIQRYAPFLTGMAPPRPIAHLSRRYVIDIKRIPAQLCVHIETDDSDGSYLVGEGFIPCQ